MSVIIETNPRPNGSVVIPPSSASGDIVRPPAVQGPKGDKGDAGPMGPVSDFISISRLAESNINGHRVLAASPDGRVSHVGKGDADAVNVLGISEGAASGGDMVSIITFGEMQESSWSWTAGPVWLGDDGLMTQVVPTTGLLVRIGVATQPTTLNVNPQVIVQL